MDTVLETPIKSKMTETDQIHGHLGYNSQDDSGDELFMEYDTVATLPLPRRTQPTSQLSSSPAPYITQPTQLLSDRSKPTSPDRPTVQVVASSPTQPSPKSTTPRLGGVLAQAMAPPGTAFRLPHGVQNEPPKRKTVIELSDDEGIKYKGGSSDEDSQTDRRDIKPSILKPRKTESISVSNGKLQGQEKDGPRHFKEIIAASMFGKSSRAPEKRQGSNLSGSVFDSRNRDEKNTHSKIAAPAPKRSADTMASAYGGSNRPIKKPRQSKPAKAQPVSDISLDDINDFVLRRKVERIKKILPQQTISSVKEALILRRGNEDDAMEKLISDEVKPLEIDLTNSEEEEDELQKPPSVTRKPVAKQNAKIPTRTIQEKYGQASQSQARPVHPSSSPPSTPPAKPRRRLVQGRKKRSSPEASTPQKPTSPPRRPVSPIQIIDSDSGIASGSEPDRSSEGSLLDFLNTCSVQDLADLGSISESTAGAVLSKKPFKNLNQIRRIVDPAICDMKTKAKSKRRRPMGEKIVDVCERMWSGYQAVDQLVHQCRELGKPVADEMKKWGVDVFGASKDGELELVTFDDVKADEKSEPSLRDSGIGTPSSTAFSADEDADDVKRISDANRRKRDYFFPQPSIMAKDVVLKDYQIVGINWLSLLFNNGLSCILADDMGLGKTCQVVAFLAHLHETGVGGPHIIVVPGSTLENWLREFQKFCPTLDFRPYYGSAAEREQMQPDLLLRPPEVIITTYNVAKPKADRKFLRSLKPTVCVYDEGHQLKNSKSKAYEELIKINARFRLLLTGTPLQNNLTELASLLGFILPEIFSQCKEDLESVFSHRAKTTDETHEALLSAQRIARARSMMTPFILRRKKHQVLRHLPPKTRRIEYCVMTASQQSLYDAERAKHRQILEDRSAGLKNSKASNILMALRQAAIHPLLFRRLYDDAALELMSHACIREPEFGASDPALCREDMGVMSDYELHRFCAAHLRHLGPFLLQDEPWMDSGKVAALVALLGRYKANGDRVLIFSQFVLVMDILEEVLQAAEIAFFRLDGGTRIDVRQDLIDGFYADESITAFLLSTKAGGAGINLACANKVVIFDSSFNPQDDVQAENRAHRVGQEREVEVVRLVSRGTVEEQILALGESKLVLDERVASGVGSAGGKEGKEKEKEEEREAKEKEGAWKVEEMLEMELKLEREGKGMGNDAT